MVIYGYIRVSTREQNEVRQLNALGGWGILPENLFTDKQSGKDFDRTIYLGMRNILREGDLLYVDSIDRLGRNYDAVKKEWYYLTRELKVDVVALDLADLFDSRKFREQGEVGRLLEDQMLSLLAWVADQERKKIRQRQREGIEIAKVAGKYKGRKPVIVPDFEKYYQRYMSRKVSKAGLARELHISRPTVDRLIAEHEAGIR